MINEDYKKEIAKNIFEKNGYNADKIDITRNDEIKADIFVLPEQRVGAIIIGDDGKNLFCGTEFDLNYYIEQFKYGMLDSKGDVAFKVFKNIQKMSNGTETSIAQITNYNQEIFIVDPLTQGEIFSYVKELCKKNNISLERINDSIGGLAYNYKFKVIFNEPLDETLKLANGKYAEDVETKSAYDDLRNRMDEYNVKVVNEEKTNVDMSDFANEYINNFHDVKLERKLNEIDENMDKNNQNNIDSNSLISKINDKLGIDDSNKSVNEMIDETDKRLDELNSN